MKEPMTITYRCPCCTRQLRVPEAAGDTELACPICGFYHHAPAADSPEARAWGNTVRAVVERRPVPLTAPSTDRTIAIACGHCDWKSVAAAEKVGPTIVCPRCGGVTPRSAAPQPAPPAPPAARPEPPAPPPPEPNAPPRQQQVARPEAPPPPKPPPPPLAAPESRAPVMVPGVALQRAPTHLACERHDLPTQRRLLQRLRECYDAGLRDPELLYLGGRYAASLGYPGEACRFLDPLANMLREESRPSPAFFPVGLLYLRVLPAGDRRDAVVGDLRALAANSPRLAVVLHRLGLEAAGRVPLDSPRHLLAEVAANVGGRGLCALHLAGHDGASAGGPATVLRLTQAASADYRAGKLAEARRALEDVLLRDGDQPDVLRNLVTLTSEQQDGEANERYWRRYVKVLLWRILRGEGALTARDDLVRFYARVAAITDRSFAEPLPRALEQLRRPGLLPRWLEAHAGLVWLEAADRAHRRQQAGRADGRRGRLALMAYWFGAFYPEFAPFLDLGRSPGTAVPVRPARSRLPFDPALRLLTRLAEWSRAGFALREADDVASPHVQVLTALVNCAARIPLRPYVLDLRKVFEAEALTPRPLRRALQDACCIPLGPWLRKLLDDKDWKGVVAHFGDEELFDGLTPMLRLFLALGHAQTGSPAVGLDVACRTVPDLTAEEVTEESQCFHLCLNVLHASIGALVEGPEDRRGAGFTELRHKIEALPEGEHLAPLKRRLLRELDDVRAQFELKEQIDQTIEQCQQLAQKDQFPQAFRLVDLLPDSPEQVRELKKNLREQLNQAQGAARLHKQIDQTVERCKELVEKGQFGEAFRLVDQLPNFPDEVAKLKQSLRQQLEEAQGSARVQGQVTGAMNQVKAHVQHGRFDDARRVVRGLPDSPGDLAELKRSVLGQIDEAKRAWDAATSENARIMARLTSGGRTLNMEALSQLARDNNLDLTNPMELNALLKAIEQHQ